MKRKNSVLNPTRFHSVSTILCLNMEVIKPVKVTVKAEDQKELFIFSESQNEHTFLFSNSILPWIFEFHIELSSQQKYQEFIWTVNSVLEDKEFLIEIDGQKTELNLALKSSHFCKKNDTQNTPMHRTKVKANFQSDSGHDASHKQNSGNYFQQKTPTQRVNPYASISKNENYKYLGLKLQSIITSTSRFPPKRKTPRNINSACVNSNWKRNSAHTSSISRLGTGIKSIRDPLWSIPQLENEEGIKIEPSSNISSGIIKRNKK